jgi:MarR family transcriptional regulator, organic hydroperoxide resistance regulator
VDHDVRPAFWAAFWAASRTLTSARDAMLERHGVAAGQQAILSRLWATDDQSPGDLARSLDLTTSALTSTVSKMEEAGLLERRASDGHHVSLKLTRRGRDLEKIFDREMRRLGERALGSLDDADRVQLVRFLRDLRTNTAGA